MRYNLLADESNVELVPRAAANGAIATLPVPPKAQLRIGSRKRTALQLSVLLKSYLVPIS